MGLNITCKRLLANKLLVSLISSPLNLTVSSMQIEVEMFGCITLNSNPPKHQPLSSQFGVGVVCNFCNLTNGSNLICGNYSAESLSSAKLWTRALTAQMKQIYGEFGVHDLCETERDGSSLLVINGDSSGQDLLRVSIVPGVYGCTVSFSVSDLIVTLLSRKPDVPIVLMVPHVLVMCRRMCVCNGIKMAPPLDDKSPVRVSFFHSEKGVPSMLNNEVPVKIYVDGIHVGAISNGSSVKRYNTPDELSSLIYQMIAKADSRACQ